MVWIPDPTAADVEARLASPVQGCRSADGDAGDPAGPVVEGDATHRRGDGRCICGFTVTLKVTGCARIEGLTEDEIAVLVSWPCSRSATRCRHSPGRCCPRSTR